MRPRKPTSKERAWIEELREVFSRCPDTIDFCATGDPDLSILCRERAKGEFDGMGTPQHMILDVIDTGGNVHTTTA